MCHFHHDSHLTSATGLRKKPESTTGQNRVRAEFAAARANITTSENVRIQARLSRMIEIPDAL